MRETENESNEKDGEGGERDSRHCCLLSRSKRAREKKEEESGYEFVV